VKEWLYFLTDESGKSYSIVNGIVKRTATPKPLIYTSDGWQDIAIAWERAMQKIGLVRNFSLPLGMVMDGAAILRYAMYRKSIEEKIYLLIQKLEVEINTLLTPGYYAMVYKYFYKGELDLSTLNDDDPKMMVNIMEGGLSKLLKANEATMYEFDVDSDPEVVQVKMDGIFLTEKHNFITTANVAPQNHILTSVFLNKEGQAFGVATFTVFRVDNPSISPSSEDYFLATGQAINSMTLSGSLNLRHTDGTGGRTYRLYLKSSTGQNILVTTLAITPDFANYPWTVTFNAANGEHFWLYAEIQAFTGSHEYADSFFSLSYKSRYRTSYIKGLKASTLFKRLIGRITGSENNADVSYLQGFDQYVISSGDLIRGLAGGKIKTSLNQFFESFKTILCAGLGIENGKILMQSVQYFLGGETGPFVPVVDPVALGEAKNVTVTPATDLIHNTFKIGYDSKQIDDVNGKYEFNNTHIYSSPITRVVKEFPLISAYNAQPFLIEITRINFEGKTTTDSKNDNENFIIDRDTAVQNDPIAGDYYSLRREVGIITGVPDPDSVFNVSLSPKRILLAWQRYINSMFYKLEGQKLKFQTTEKNADFTTTIAGITIQENSDLTITTDRLFLPFYFDFDTQVPVDLVSIMEQTPNRAFTFTWLGSMFTGFLMKAGIAPNTNKEQAFKLLAAPSNDMTKLI
jgi:hypothetical protein